MRLLSLNVNGFRSAEQRGLWDLIVEHRIDVACFQEIKGQLKPSQHPSHHKPYPLSEFVGGISPIPNQFGVATMAKQELELLMTHMEQNAFRGRLVGAKLENSVEIWNVYAPTIMSNDIDTDCLPFWHSLLECSERWVNKPSVLCGDFNLIGSTLDVHTSLLKNRTKTIGAQYRVYNQLLSQGWVDCWRQCHPEKIRYTYWSKPCQKMRMENRGVRLDYVLCSPALQPSVVLANIVEVPSKMSDHASVLVEFDFSTQT